MVQVFDLSPTSSSASMIGSALGTGISKRAGLAEAENAANMANGDPVKLAFSLARANMASNNSMDRSLGQIYEQLLARTEGKQFGENLSPMGGMSNSPNPDLQGEVSPQGIIPPSTDVPSNASPVNQENAQSSPIVYPKGNNYSPQEVNSLSHQFMMDMRPDLVQGSSDWGRIPTFNYAEKSDLRPEEEAQLRQNLTDRKLPPKVQDRIVDNLRNDIKTRYTEKLKNFGFDDKRQLAINQKMDNFRKLSDENLKPLLGKYDSTLGFGGRPKTANDLKNKYFQYAGNLPVNLTEEQMHAQAGAQLQNDINRIDALAAIPDLPWIRDPSQMKDTLKPYKQAYGPLYQEGFYETLKEDAVNKGMGLEELHETLWGDQTDRGSLQAIASLPAAKMYLDSSGSPGLEGKRGKVNPNYTKEREPYINNLSKRLMNIKNNDDLILLRSQVLANGGLEGDFNDALEKAQDEGLQLSPFQRSQAQELQIPRLRPIWEIFNPGAWKQWIMHDLGKR